MFTQTLVTNVASLLWFNAACKRGGRNLYFRLDIILVKGLSKHTLNMYFLGMKIDPKYAY